jgi:hypothetical protein
MCRFSEREDGMMSDCKRRRKIVELNDAFRRSLSGGRVMKTASIAALPGEVQACILWRLRNFSEFTADNDPHGEHDFGSFYLGGHHVFWKIEYYDERMECGSEDPADPKRTTRVLTIMLAEDY